VSGYILEVGSQRGIVPTTSAYSVRYLSYGTGSSLIQLASRIKWNVLLVCLRSDRSSHRASGWVDFT
jgi:hypothetical protein